MSVLVRFDAEFRLTDEDLPPDYPTLTYASVQQAVQDALGFTGVIVLDVTEYEEAAAPKETP